MRIATTASIASILIVLPLNAQSSPGVPAESGTSAATRSRVVATLPDSTFWPEGVDYDPRTGRYYVASVRHRTIAEVDANGKVRELWPRDRPGVGAMLGVRVDTARAVLWATTSGIRQMEGYVAADSGIAALLRVPIADGARTRARRPRRRA